jgi:inorganic pyrophosphatase
MLASPIGLFKMSDEQGPDDHVVCVPCDDPGWNEVRDVNELSSQLRAEISHFFSVYKDRDPTRHSEVKGWGDRDAAVAALSEARARFRDRGH